jgi:formate dehydrogenase major subunit
MGKLSPQELDELLRGVPVRPRARQGAGALPADEARREAARCLECDCAARETCGLRLLATRHGARPAAWAGERRRFHRDSTHPEVIYESGKCIQCGLCVRTAQAEGERMGLTFLGRSFTAAVGTPFGEPLVKALTHSARKCAEVCPTGALALRRAAAGGRPASPPAPLPLGEGG